MAARPRCGGGCRGLAGGRSWVCALLKAFFGPPCGREAIADRTQAGRCSGTSKAEPRPVLIGVLGENQYRSRLDAGAESRRRAQVLRLKVSKAGEGF